MYSQFETPGVVWIWGNMHTVWDLRFSQAYCSIGKSVLDVVLCCWVSSEISKDWSAFILTVQHTYVTHLTSHTATLLALLEPKIKALWSPSNNTVLYTKRLKSSTYILCYISNYILTYLHLLENYPKCQHVQVLFVSVYKQVLFVL